MYIGLFNQMYIYIYKLDIWSIQRIEKRVLPVNNRKALG